MGRRQRGIGLESEGKKPRATFQWPFMSQLTVRYRLLNCCVVSQRFRRKQKVDSPLDGPKPLRILSKQSYLKQNHYIAPQVNTAESCLAQR
jgi:hypothetical protein